MSAPSIPNLLSSRGRGGGRGGLRGRRGGGQPSGSRADAAIQGTDTDAAVSRMSAVDLGYLSDPYAGYFVSQIDGPNLRRLPIINRGTYTRTQALNNLVDAFLTRDETSSSKTIKQIISLGAGTDTRPFKLFDVADASHIIYHELDFDVTSTKKLQLVRGIPVLSKILTDISTNDTGSWTSHPNAGGEYYAHGIDLRSLHAETELLGLRLDVPTLVLSECCLCYLQRTESEQLIQYFASRIPNLSIVLYEPMHLDDAFGDTMVSNLAARQISMPGLQAYRNAKDQKRRLADAGFTTAKYMTIDDAWEDWISQEEKDRVHQLEGLDEVEEWKLLAGHYIVAWGYRGEGFTRMAPIQGKN